MNTTEYLAPLSYGKRVWFMGNDGHPKTGQECTIVRVIPNPSRREQHQWYDVRFDDYSMGRFLGKFLSVAPTDDKARAA
jgi:hypothetical protein